MTKWTWWDEFKWKWTQKWRMSRIGNFFYLVECHLFRRYNWVKARELDVTFHEPSDLFPHVAFELLRIHIEEERGLGFMDEPKRFKDALREYTTPDPDDPFPRGKDSYSLAELRCYWHSWKTHRELIDLYEWWTVTRPQRQKAIEDAYDAWDPKNPFSRIDHITQLEDDYHDEETEMLIRLVKVRGAMWT